MTDMTKCLWCGKQGKFRGKIYDQEIWLCDRCLPVVLRKIEGLKCKLS